MPLEVMDKSLWHRLRKRFNLGDYGLPIDAMVSEVIVPVTSLDDLLGRPLIASVTKSLAAGAGAYVEYHRPASGKRWRLLLAVKDASIGSGTMGVYDGVFMVPFMADAAAQTVVWFGDKVYIDERMSVGLTTTGNVGDGAIVLRLWYVEEDAQVN